MKIAPTLRAIAALAVVGVALAGCSAGDPTDDGGGEQTLLISQSGPPASFTVGAWAGGESMLSTAVYDTLVTLGVDGELLPGMAESWEFSDDRTQLTFTIRDSMTFTDGTAADAPAIVQSMEALRAGPSTSTVWANVSGIEATDDSTIVVTFSRADAAYLPNMVGFNGAIGAPDSLAAESSALEPVGSGPYILNMDQTVTGSKYVLDRNPDHWNVDAYPYEHVEVSIIADATAAQNALRSGQLDVLATAGSKDVVDTFPDAQFNKGENNPTAVAVLWLADRGGVVVPALADPRVREAINLAFDRDAISQNLLGPGSQPTNQVVNPVNEAFSEEFFAATPFDVETAKSLMADAGYAEGFAVTMPSTVVSTQFESVITQSLGDIGIEVTWEPIPFQDFYSKVFGQNYGMYFMFNGLTAFDAQDIQASLGGAFNPFNSTTPELESLRAAADSADDANQGEAFRDVNEYLVDENWFAPLAVTSGFWVASKDVNYTPPTAYGVNFLPFAPAED